jgi:signal transduction histidine kinase
MTIPAAALEEALGWAIEGREGSTVQARLFEAERLLTLGGIAAALLHDLAQPVVVAQMNATRLADLAVASPALLKLVARHRGELSEGDAEVLRHLAEEAGEISADLLTGLSHMQEMLEQVRRLARKPSPGDPKRADPVPVLRFVAGACRSMAVRTGTRLALDLPSELPFVAMPTTALTQVTVNVMKNALEALEKQPGGRVSVAARVDADALLLTVEDDGPGIPPSILEKVGRPFFSTRPEGTGLGVAQCRRLVGAAGGTFQIESTEGEGTRVLVRLPLAPS